MRSSDEATDHLDKQKQTIDLKPSPPRDKCLVGCARGFDEPENLRQPSGKHPVYYLASIAIEIPRKLSSKARNESMTIRT